MSIQRNVSTRVHQPNSPNDRTKSKNGIRCHNTSCSCGRAGTPGHRAAPMGQKVVNDIFLRQKQDQAKYNLFIFMVRLLRIEY